jgi:ATP-dependent protease ClpP protease subunit
LPNAKTITLNCSRNWRNESIAIDDPIPANLTTPPIDIQYVTFSEEINEQAAGKFIHWLDLICNDRPRHNAVHMLFNSSGGMIVDAINMHNYVKGYPADIPITMFNSGGVQSAAVLVFLSGGMKKELRIRADDPMCGSGKGKRTNAEGAFRRLFDIAD